jgi:MinD-like ATPase involved in chromosome partitioning or flagellar assembly
VNHTELLKTIGMFSQVSDDDLQQIAGLLKEKRVAKDAVICRQGEAGDALYIVQSGRIKSATTDAVGRERVLSFYTDCQFFGEMAILNGEEYPATRQAVADSRLLVIQKEDFEQFLGLNVQVMLQMMKVVAERQAVTSARMVRSEGADSIAMTGPSGGKVFTVFSPKGGVGKSTVATNLAVSLAHQHAESVVLVDLSLTFGHTLLLLNLVPKSSLASTTADALKKMGLQEGIAYYLAVHPSSSLRVLAGSTRPEEGESVTGEAAKVVIEELKKHFSYVVVDTSSTFTDPVLAALESADRVLMLCTPEISVLRDVRECQRVFNDVVHMTRDHVLYLMNNIYPHKGLSKAQFEDALQQSLYMELPYGGDVPLKASLRGEAFVETQSGSSLAKAIQKLGSQLVAETALRIGAVQEKKRGLFGR